jgi:N12 class adenine-specific DNA methylase
MRASDLDMKIDYLRRRNGARVVTFATATPIANSVTEAYVMQRYLRPDLLQAAGIEVFDTWAATFGQVVSQVELAPEGGSNFRMKSRFARFANVPEMLRMLHVAADVKTAEDLALPVPDLKPRPDG